jgi:transposase
MTEHLVSDALWALVAPLLPERPPRPKGGRPPLDDRQALEGIAFVLHTGIAWARLPKQMGHDSGMTCW